METGGQEKVIIGAWNQQTFMVEKQFQTNMFSVFLMVAVASEDSVVIGS